jgi:hypothetical protein
MEQSTEQFKLLLKPEMAMKIRMAALRKYGNSRSTSRYMEEVIEAGMKVLGDEPK